VFEDPEEPEAYKKKNKNGMLYVSLKVLFTKSQKLPY
jgi:hypothetical protein